MKNVIKFWAGAAVVAVLAAGCAKDAPANNAGDKGTITVSIKSQAASRSVLSDLTGIANFENAINEFDVYVFDYVSGFLEEKATSSNGQPVTMTGISTAGQKRIVVIANGSTLTGVPTIANGGGLTRYSDLANGTVSFSEQTFSDGIITGLTKGMLMTGESPATTITEAGPNNIPVEVKRVVSKIELGSISFDEGIALSDLLKFSITDVGIQRAIGRTTIGTGAIAPVTTPSPTYYGAWTEKIPSGAATNTSVADANLLNSGIDLQGTIASLLDALNLNITIGGVPLGGSVVSNLSSLLSSILPIGGLDETLGAAVTRVGGDLSAVLSKVVNGFWYVLPNDGTTSVPTLLTLKGSYNGQAYYYPIEINSPTSGATTSDSDATVGAYLERNTRYVLNITFNNLIGMNDPDTPGKLATMTVTVSPKTWEGPVTQNTVW